MKKDMDFTSVILKKDNGIWSLCQNVAETLIKGNFMEITATKNGPKITPQIPVRSGIRCQQRICGYQINPFIWVSNKYKTVYFENPKVASSSIKNAIEN
jgi:hypothetical protein